MKFGKYDEAAGEGRGGAKEMDETKREEGKERIATPCSSSTLRVVEEDWKDAFDQYPTLETDSNELTIILRGAEIFSQGIWGSGKKYSVRAYLPAHWEERKLPKGDKVLFGHHACEYKVKAKEGSCVSKISLGDMALKFNPRTPDAAILLQLVEVGRGSSSETVVGEIVIRASTILDRDALKTFANNKDDGFELYRLMHPRTRNHDKLGAFDPCMWRKRPTTWNMVDKAGKYKYIVGSMTLKVSYRESWKCLLVNIEPSFKTTSEEKMNNIGFSEEVQRMKRNIRRVKVCWASTLPIRRTMDRLFKFDNPGKSVFVLICLEVAVFVIPTSRLLVVFPSLLILHMYIMWRLRKRAGNSRRFDENLLNVTCGDEAALDAPNALVRVSVVAAHALPQVDPIVNPHATLRMFFDPNISCGKTLRKCCEPIDIFLGLWTAAIHEHFVGDRLTKTKKSASRIYQSKDDDDDGDVDWSSKETEDEVTGVLFKLKSGTGLGRSLIRRVFSNRWKKYEAKLRGHHLLLYGHAKGETTMKLNVALDRYRVSEESEISSNVGKMLSIEDLKGDTFRSPSYAASPRGLKHAFELIPLHDSDPPIVLRAPSPGTKKMWLRSLNRETSTAESFQKRVDNLVVPSSTVRVKNGLVMIRTSEDESAGKWTPFESAIIDSVVLFHISVGNGTFSLAAVPLSSVRNCGEVKSPRIEQALVSSRTCSNLAEETAVALRRSVDMDDDDSPFVCIEFSSQDEVSMLDSHVVWEGRPISSKTNIRRSNSSSSSKNLMEHLGPRAKVARLKSNEAYAAPPSSPPVVRKMVMWIEDAGKRKIWTNALKTSETFTTKPDAMSQQSPQLVKLDCLRRRNLVRCFDDCEHMLFAFSDTNIGLSGMYAQSLYVWYLYLRCIREVERDIPYQETSRKSKRMILMRRCFLLSDLHNYFKYSNPSHEWRDALPLLCFLCERGFITCVGGDSTTSKKGGNIASIASMGGIWRFNCTQGILKRMTSRVLKGFANDSDFDGTEPIPTSGGIGGADSFVTCFVDSAFSPKASAKEGDNSSTDNMWYIGRTNTEYKTMNPIYGLNLKDPPRTMIPLLSYLRKSRNKSFRRGENVEVSIWGSKEEHHTSFTFVVDKPVMGTSKAGGNKKKENQDVKMKTRRNSTITMQSKALKAMEDRKREVAECSPLPAKPLVEFVKKKGSVAFVPWDDCNVSLYFRVLDEDFSLDEGFDYDEVGHLRIPLRDLIAKPKLIGKPQPVIYKWFPIDVLPGTVAQQDSFHGHRLGWVKPSVLLHIEVMLRTSDVDNFDQKNESMFNIFNRIKGILRKVNDAIEGKLNMMEKFVNLFNWTHPRKTKPVLFIFVFLGLLLLVVPMKVLVMGLVLFPFTGIFRPPGGVGFKTQHMLSFIPNKVEQCMISKWELPMPVTSTTRLYNSLSNTIIAGYARHAVTRASDGMGAIVDSKWKRHFLTLSLDGEVLCWENHHVACSSFESADVPPTMSPNVRAVKKRSKKFVKKLSFKKTGSRKAIDLNMDPTTETKVEGFLGSWQLDRHLSWVNADARHLLPPPNDAGERPALRDHFVCSVADNDINECHALCFVDKHSRDDWVSALSLFCKPTPEVGDGVPLSESKKAR